MTVPLPPLGSVRAFEAAARHLSFTKAAKELGITQAAVSWQIRSLEERLGTALFVRGKGRLALTTTGQRLAPDVSSALTDLVNAFARLAPAAGTLRIGAPPTFAHNWLTSRLRRFSAQHPAIAIEIDASTRADAVGKGGLDLSVRRGAGSWPGLEARWLMPVVLAPVCAPSLSDLSGQKVTIAELCALPLLQPAALWEKWLAALRQPLPANPRHPGVSYTRQHLAIEAAVRGEGVALANPLFCADALASGRLIFPVADRVTLSDEGYWLVRAQRSRHSRSAEMFREWLERTAREETKPVSAATM